MKRSSRAWIMLPIILILIAVVGLVVSNYQKEAGLIEPSKGGPFATNAVLVAYDLASGRSDGDYSNFANALLAASVAQRNLPLINPADTRLGHLLRQAVDCLAAAREAWQAEINEAWDPGVQGLAVYWQTLHPALELPESSQLTAIDIRRASTEQASNILRQAVDLAG